MAPDFMKELKAHKPEVLVGAAGAVAAIALYLRQKHTKAAGASPGSPAVSTPATTVTPGYAPFPGTTVATTTGTDAYTGMENQILGLQQAILGLATKSTSTKPTSSSTSTKPTATKPSPASQVATEPITAQTPYGQGYSAGPGYASGAVTGLTGGLYTTIASYTATLATLQAGGTAYYEPSLGNFAPITSVTQFKALEHTGTHKTAQTTTWAKAP